MFVWSGCVKEKTGSRQGGVVQNTEQVGLSIGPGCPSQNIDVSLDACI